MTACCSINMRIFKTAELIILSLSILRSCNGAPAELSRTMINPSHDLTSIIDATSSSNGDHYDQRQNGTENYRIHVDGVVLVVAPIEGLLAAGSIPGIGDSGILGTGQQDDPIVELIPKPVQTTTGEPRTDSDNEKPSIEKSFQGNGLRLMNLISPYLRRIHRHHV